MMGTPRTIPIDDHLQEVIDEMGVTPPSDGLVVSYSKIYWQQVDRIVSANIKQTKRNNSCLSYVDTDGVIQYGYMKKVPRLLLVKKNIALFHNKLR